MENAPNDMDEIEWTKNNWKFTQELGVNHKLSFTKIDWHSKNGTNVQMNEAMGFFAHLTKEQNDTNDDDTKEEEKKKK